MNTLDHTTTVYISGTPAPTTTCPPQALDAGKELGGILGEKGITVATTSTTGFPLWVAIAAARQGATTLAFSPAASANEHDNVYQYTREGFTSVIYTGFGASGASVMGVRSADAVIFGCGGMASILELITAVQEGRPIGILEGPWGTDEVLEEMLATHYPDYAHVMAHSDPAELVQMLARHLAHARSQN